MKKRVVLISSVALLLTACSAPYRDAPQAINFKKTQQYKLQSMHHWQVISNNIVDSLIKKKISPIYIKANPKSKFEKVLLNMIKDDLINKGIEVKTIPNNANKLSINIDVVKFSKGRDWWNNKQGLFTFLGAGVYVASKANLPVALATGVVASEAGYAYYSKHTSTPQYEININATVIDKDKYIASVNNVYYIQDNDARLYYRQNKIQMKTLKIKGE